MQELCSCNRQFYAGVARYSYALPIGSAQPMGFLLPELEGNSIEEADNGAAKSTGRRRCIDGGR